MNTPAVRRQTVLKELPRSAAIPKFLHSDEIRNIQAIKRVCPEMEWDEIVKCVVFLSVKNISSIIGEQ